MEETIVAPATPAGRGGISIIRVSGKYTSEVIKLLTGKDLPQPRVASLRKINNINNSGLIDEGNAVRPFANAADPKNFPYGAGFGPCGCNRIAYDTNAILEYPFDRVTTGEIPDETHLAEKPDYYKSEEWKSYNNGKRLEYLKKRKG